MRCKNNMICCTNCFKDTTVKSAITSLKTKGNCDICGVLSELWVYEEKAGIKKTAFSSI